MRYILLINILFFGVAACQEKPLPPADSLEAYVGSWKVTGPQDEVYYMILKKDGSGSTTRGQGEFGTWKISKNQIETQWIPKNLQIQFSSGSAKVSGIPDSKSLSKQKFMAERVDKIPDTQ